MAGEAIKPVSPIPNAADQHRQSQELVATSNSGQVHAAQMGEAPQAIGVHHFPGGTTFTADNLTSPTQTTQVILVNKGPNGEVDFQDGTGRYWAMSFVMCQDKGDGEDKGAKVYWDGSWNRFWGVVINIPEVISGTNSLKVYSGSLTAAALTSDCTIARMWVEQAGRINNSSAPTVGSEVCNRVYLINVSSATTKGRYQGDVFQMMTDEASGWGPAQFGP